MKYFVNFLLGTVLHVQTSIMIGCLSFQHAMTELSNFVHQHGWSKQLLHETIFSTCCSHTEFQYRQRSEERSWGGLRKSWVYILLSQGTDGLLPLQGMILRSNTMFNFVFTFVQLRIPKASDKLFTSTKNHASAFFSCVVSFRSQRITFQLTIASIWKPTSRQFWANDI